MSLACKRVYHHVSEVDQSSPLAKRPKRSNRSPSPVISHSHPALSLYYVKVCGLREYLLSTLPASSKSRRKRISLLGLAQSGADNNGKTVATSGLDTDARLAGLLDSVLVGVGPCKERDLTRTKDFEVFSQQANSSVTSSLEDGTASQPEVRSSCSELGLHVTDLAFSAVLCLSICYVVLTY